VQLRVTSPPLLERLGLPPSGVPVGPELVEEVRGRGGIPEATARFANATASAASSRLTTT
jgi:hypothetical protein